MKIFITIISLSLFTLGFILLWESDRKKFIDGDRNRKPDIAGYLLLSSIVIPAVYHFKDKE